LLTEEGEPHWQLAFHLIEHSAGYAEVTRLSERLKPRCYVHSISVKSIGLLDHVTKIDPNAKSHAPVFGKLCVTTSEFLLQLHSTLHGLYGTGELSQHGVARRVNDATVVPSNAICEELAVTRERVEGRAFVVSHHPRVASYVCAQNCG
jgi:hypothetical protein